MTTTGPARGEAASEHPRARVGISACLLGQAVRYDGGHKRDRYLDEILGAHVDWVPVCPEVETGMTTPRPALRLVRRESGVRMVAIDGGEDWTDRVNAWARRRIPQVQQQPLDGFVLKKDSPSCGMERVRVYDRNGVPSRDGRGLFASALMQRHPALAVEEEGRLNDARLRENFVTRIFAARRWHDFVERDSSPAGLVEFHASHKMLLLAHSPERYYRLGPLVAGAGSEDLATLLATYEQGFMAALASPASPRRHVNALHHLCGFLKHDLDADGKRELLGAIDQYRVGVVPLIAPLTLLRHHLRRVGHPWVGRQTYLDPYPTELGLRSVT